MRGAGCTGMAGRRAVPDGTAGASGTDFSTTGAEAARGEVEGMLAKNGDVPAVVGGESEASDDDDTGTGEAYCCGRVGFP